MSFYSIDLKELLAMENSAERDAKKAELLTEISTELAARKAEIDYKRSETSILIRHHSAGLSAALSSLESEEDSITRCEKALYSIENSLSS